jgi:arachidonate 15-lipoxygenase
MLPTLPQFDADRTSRDERLSRIRSELPYAWDRPEGVATAADVPLRHGVPPGVIARAAAIGAELAANRVAARLRTRTLDEDAPSDPAFCDDVFVTIDPPPIARLGHDPSSAARAFAWQRVAGANPFMIERVAAPLARVPGARDAPLPIDPEDSLARAADEGRVFLADWSAYLAGIPAGAGRFVPAPIALFVRPRGHRALASAAIQRDPSDPSSLVTPADGPAWREAVRCAQIADCNVLESFFHLGRGHFLLEAFAMATERQLSERHPIHVLLDPHFHGTLGINQAARDKLVVPGGELEELMSPSLEGSLTLVRRAVQTWDLTRDDLEGDLRARGVDDPEILPEYPYRDDAREVRAAIDEWVLAYVSVAYPDDEVLRADPEITGWFRELRARDGGRLAGLPEDLPDRAALARLLSFVLHAASVFHAAVNYTQEDFMSWVPNMPAAAYGSPASPRWPSRGRILQQVTFMTQQSRIRDNRLGDYPSGHFRDDRVRPLLENFQRRLLDASHRIAGRQHGRFLSYPYLDPARLTASIHI